MRLSNAFTAYAEALWKARREALGGWGDVWEREIAAAGEDGALLRYILGALPLSDLGEYPASLFVGFARHARYVREAFPWCAALPEPLFLRGVLCPRINTEELADCRGLFCRELEPLVRGLALGEAILEVNRWCAQHVTYRSTDDRTSSPLAIYRRGWGRCGEESTFTVTALRSVGICARQVYAPWWSHCDDNHAWVEAWDGEAWRYLGACEPEPELDRGWFTGAAARAMLIHTRSFVGDLPAPAWLYPGVDPVDLDVRGGVAYETLTARYAPVQVCTVTTEPGARVVFSVMNMAGLRPIAHRTADGAGAARLRLGLGSVHVTAEGDGFFAEALWDTRAGAHLVLKEGAGPGAFTFTAPAPPEEFPQALTPGQKAQRARVLEEAEEKRAAWQAAFAGSGKEAGGIYAQVAGLVTEKDRADGLDPLVVEDCGRAFAWEGQFPEEVFLRDLLSPRIGLEPLRPWRGGALGVGNPGLLSAWIGAHFAPLRGYEALPQSPRSALKLRAVGESGRRVLFCALCRQMGVPARLSALDGEPEYWQDGGFRRAGGDLSASLRLRAPQGRGGLCGQDYTLSRWQEGEWKALSTGDVPGGGELVVPLPPGAYRLFTVVRLPNGSQLCRQVDLELAGGEGCEALLDFPRAAGAQLLQQLPLPPFSLGMPGGEAQASASVLAQAAYSLLCWLEPGREPTEHLLLELREAASGLSAQGEACALYLLTPEGKGGGPALGRLLGALPDARLWQGDFSEVPALSRQLFVDPERLPLVLLADAGGRGLYACSGYNVGLGALLLRLLQAAGEAGEEG